MYGYVYLTTNLVNGKRYVGQKKSDVFLYEKYLGSGKSLKLAVEKYGKENFKVELIEWCESKEQLDDREKYWINYYNACKSRNFYNIAIGGEGGDITLGYTEDEYKLFCEKSKSSKNVLVHKGNLESKIEQCDLELYLSNGWEMGISDLHRQNMSKSRVGIKHKPHSEETKRKIGESQKGKIISEESRRKMSEKQRGKIISQETKEKLSKSMSGKGNPMYGKHHTEETKKRISEVRKEKYRNGEYVISEETRRKMSESHKGITKGKDSLKGKICITKDFTNKYIYPNELEYYESLGYRRGRYLKKK